MSIEVSYRLVRSWLEMSLEMSQRHFGVRTFLSQMILEMPHCVQNKQCLPIVCGGARLAISSPLPNPERSARKLELFLSLSLSTLGCFS